jgi:hypothetical protein
MMIKSSEEIVIYESLDGGKMVYSRKSGETASTFRSVDELTLQEEKLATRWVKLKDAVFLNDPTINNLIHQIEIIMELKK